MYRKAKIQKALEEMPKTIENWRKVKKALVYIQFMLIICLIHLFYFLGKTQGKRKEQTIIAFLILIEKNKFNFSITMKTLLYNFVINII